MSTAEIKYPKRFLDLNMNSPVEDSKLAYDEMAACWEKVTMTTYIVRVRLPANTAAYQRFRPFSVSRDTKPTRSAERRLYSEAS